ncbi:hypothetical protein J7E62_31070 [Variovorax paradoxus]|nr:hypothetical protein [Variovorax paradoxus]
MRKEDIFCASRVGSDHMHHDCAKVSENFAHFEEAWSPAAGPVSQKSVPVNGTDNVFIVVVLVLHMHRQSNLALYGLHRVQNPQIIEAQTD